MSVKLSQEELSLPINEVKELIKTIDNLRGSPSINQKIKNQLCVKKKLLKKRYGL